MRVSRINAVPIAMATTLGLLLLMSSLINVEFEMPEWAPPAVPVNAVMPKIEVEPPRPLPPVKPAEPAQPPPPIPDTVEVRDPGPGNGITIPPPPVNPPTPTMGMSSGNLMPIVEVATQYPRAAISRGLDELLTFSCAVTESVRELRRVV